MKTCLHCNAPNARPRASYCSRACSTAAWKAAHPDRVRDQAREGYHRRKPERARKAWAKKRAAIVNKYKIAY